MACLMTPASWVPEKGRLASEERDGCARELNRGRCADMWVSPQVLRRCNTGMCTVSSGNWVICVGEAGDGSLHTHLSAYDVTKFGVRCH